MQKSNQTRREIVKTPGNIPFILLDLFFLTVSFFYLWLWVNPALIYQYQEPVFFAESDIIKTALSVPGGFISYLGSFLAQFFIIGWIGSLIITGCFLLTILFTRKCLSRIAGENTNLIYSLIPAVLLLALHSLYAFNLSTTLGFLATLGFFNGYIRLPVKRDGYRILFFVLLSVVLYILTSGEMLLFAVFCALFEATQPNRGWIKRMIYGIVYVLWGFSIPYITVSYFVLVRYRDTFNWVFPFGFHEKNWMTIFSLYFFLPAGMILTFIFRFVNIKKQDGRLSLTVMRFIQWFRNRNASVIQSILLLLMMSGALFFSFNRDGQTLIRVDYYARRRMWNELINTVIKHPVNHELVTFQYNRALYHTGRLVQDMFSYPQRLGPDGLFLSDEFEQKARLQKSDLYFDMGHVNCALRWAHEAMSMRGETAWTLQRIAQIALLNRQKAYAEICITKLDKTLFYRGWARTYRKYLEDQSLIEKDPILKPIQFFMPKEDFIMSSNSNTADLKALLKENPQNRMAFEYLMANYLLNRQLGDFVGYLHYLKDLQYAQLPRHFEEAVLLYQTMNSSTTVDLAGYTVRPSVINRYHDYFRILQKNRGDKQKAKEELWKVHGNTYWYYIMYSKIPQKKEQPE